METALLTTQFRLRSIDSESQSLSSERTWKPDDPKLTGTQATTTSRATVLAPWHKTGGHNGFLSPLAKIQLSFFIKIHSPGAWACRPNRGRGPRAAAEATQHNVTKPHRPLTYRGVGNAAASAGAAGPFEGLRARTEQSDGAPRTKLELLPCCQSKMSSTNQELSPCCQSNMSWAKRLLYVFIYHC